MPYFPEETDGAIEIPLKNGDTVTLVEKKLNVADRKAMVKRFLLLQYEFKFKTKLGEDIDKRMEAAGLDRNAYDKVAEEGVELIDGMSDDVMSLYATLLSMRFQSWDVFATRKDFEESRPVELDRDSIILFADSDPRNFLLLEEIVNGLKGHDEREQKKGESKPAEIGNGFTVKTAF